MVTFITKITSVDHSPTVRASDPGRAGRRAATWTGTAPLSLDGSGLSNEHTSACAGLIPRSPPPASLAALPSL